MDQHVLEKLMAAELGKREGNNKRLQGSGKSWERERSGLAFHSSDEFFYYTSDTGDNLVKIRENPGQDIGARVWDLAIQFSKYIEQNKNIIRNREILEVGAGTGLVGLVAKSLGAKSVILTDLPRVLSILDEQVGLQPDQSNLFVEELTWGKHLDTYEEKYRHIDLVLACDMAAPVSEVDNLILSLQKLFEINSKQEVLFGMNKYREFSPPFITKAKKLFNCIQIHSEDFDEKFVSDRIEMYWLKKLSTDH